MSEASYQLNVKRGLTGPTTGTCYPASFDRLSERMAISPITYAKYETVRKAYVTATKDKPEAISSSSEISQQSQAVQKRVMTDLGVYSPKNLVELRVETEKELRESLARLALGNFRTVVLLDTGDLHAVGVMPVEDDYYTAVSTWTPFEGGVPVSVGEIYEYLDRYPRLKTKPGGRKSYKTRNIVAIPPEPKR